MPTFLIRDYDDPRGYKEMTPPMGGLPRLAPGYESPGVFQNGESYVPWGITLDNRVVYHLADAIAREVRPVEREHAELRFREPPQFAQWRDAYYDVVVLGATHWRFNPGVLPSHLNKNLRTYAVSGWRDWSADPCAGPTSP